MSYTEPTPGYHGHGGEKGRYVPYPPGPNLYAARERRRLMSPHSPVPNEQVEQTADDDLWKLHPEDFSGTPEYAETVFDPSGAGHPVNLPRTRPQE